MQRPRTHLLAYSVRVLNGEPLTPVPPLTALRWIHSMQDCASGPTLSRGERVVSGPVYVLCHGRVSTHPPIFRAQGSHPCLPRFRNLLTSAISSRATVGAWRLPRGAACSP
jgi:hypothetical protein